MHYRRICSPIWMLRTGRSCGVTCSWIHAFMRASSEDEHKTEQVNRHQERRSLMLSGSLFLPRDAHLSRCCSRPRLLRMSRWTHLSRNMAQTGCVCMWMLSMSAAR